MAIASFPLLSCYQISQENFYVDACGWALKLRVPSALLGILFASAYLVVGFTVSDLLVGPVNAAMDLSSLRVGQIMPHNPTITTQQKTGGEVLVVRFNDQP